MLTPSAKAKADAWLAGPYDEETKSAIRAMSDDALQSAFGKDLSFGTAGMRGLVGPGTNRLNQYTIRAATQGLANYINSQPTTVPKRVAISYDSRLSSPEFATQAALVLIGNDIEALLCPTPMPTPYLSFICREKNCCAGIMITASHNPPEYNGYKVYWSDGAQVLPPHDEGIISEVQNISPNKVRIGAADDPRLIIADETLIERYLKAIYPLQLCLKENQNHGDQLKVIYTPLHGAGVMLMEKALDAWGFTNLTYVEEQKQPDGHFPTTKSPNPEDPKALALGNKLLASSNGDILLATDPDADRLGVSIMHQGKPRFLTGNEIAILCTDHILKKRAQEDTLPSNAAIIKSIVTTPLLDTLAKTYDVTCLSVLTGFKYIGQKIHTFEKTREHTFIFGAEESHGYLIGTHARDKDGIASACLLCEIALDAKLSNQTLIDRLEAIYKRYGYYTSQLINIALAQGTEAMIATIGELRAHPPKTIGDISVLSIDDYQAGQSRNLKTGKLTKLKLPRSNVLIFNLEHHIRIIIRPSGTEPKLKIYGLAMHPKSATAATELLERTLLRAKKWFT